MHKAPTVVYPVGRSRFHAITLLAVGAVAACVQTWWMWRVDAVDWRQGLGLFAAALAAAAAFRGWLLSPAGNLRWDGQHWSWNTRETSINGVVAPRLDFQQVLLLQFFGPAGRTHWFWLEQGADPDNWRALRRAVHARAGPITEVDDSAPAIEPPGQGPVVGP